MVFRRHGVIGGPRKRIKPNPKMKSGFRPTTTLPNAIVVSSKHDSDVSTKSIKITEEDKVEAVVVLCEEVEEIDPILEEDKDFDFEEEFLKDPLVCELCGFISKSERGLKSHKRWKHTTEVV